jgi:hypothetical protein
VSQALSIDTLQRLQSVMTHMLEEAANANWQELSRLDSERRVLLEYIGTQALTHTDRLDGAAMASGQLQARQRLGHDHPATADKKSHATAMPAADARVTQSPEHQALCKTLKKLDQRIIDTVQQARRQLIEQTRDLRAQVCAKNGYEKARNMRTSSHS